MKFLHLTITTRMERNLALSNVRLAISTTGGWIVDHNLFSNKSANINFEIPIGKVPDFMVHLDTHNLHPNLHGDLPLGSEGDLRGNIALTFIHQDPDMKRDVPAFG